MDELRDAAVVHEGGTLHVAVAWANDLGAFLFSEAIGGRVQDVHPVVGLSWGGTTAEALLRLLGVVTTLRVFPTDPFVTFHPKIYLFTGGAAGRASQTAIVGSCNLTYGGLVANHEASLVLEARTPDDVALQQVVLGEIWNAWRALSTDAAVRPVATPDDIKDLYLARLVSTEVGARRRRARAARGAGIGAPFGGSPPSRPTRPAGYTRTKLPFAPSNDDAAPLTGEEISVVPEPAAPPAAPAVVAAVAAAATPDFYVRTLTPTDYRKLMGTQSGTLEPDITAFARNRHPAFWNWPANYVEVKHRTVIRKEWAARGLLVSSRSPQGVPVDVVLWERPERQGGILFRTHPLEHRIRLERPQLVAAIPANFDAQGLLVIERPSAGPTDYIIRLIAKDDVAYAGYAQYLTHDRPGHKFGYAPQQLLLGTALSTAPRDSWLRSFEQKQ